MSAIEPIRPVGAPYHPRPVERRRHDEDGEPTPDGGDPREEREEPREDDGLPHVDIRA